MYWKMFSSTPSLYPLEVNSGEEAGILKTSKSIAIGENEKSVFYFMKKPKWTFWATQYLFFLIFTQGYAHLLQKEREREHKRNIISASVHTLTGDQTHSLGMSPAGNRTRNFWRTA